MHAGRFEREWKVVDGSLLQLRPQVNQQVAATDQIQFGERRVLRHILAREDAEIANGFTDLVATFLPDEEPLQPRRRDIPRDAGGINALTRFLDGLIADVRGENLDE